MSSLSWRLALRLAVADLLGETRLAAFSVLSIAAVLAPLLILAGLRAGVVEGMRQTILSDPRARQVLSITHAEYDAGFFRDMRARPDVLHVAPRTRQLSASMLIDAGDRSRQTRAQIVPSETGDPLLPAGLALGDGQVVLSATLATRLRIGAGAAITGRIDRRVCGREEARAIPLTVAGVAAPSAADRDTVFVPVALADDLESWQEPRIEQRDDGSEDCVIATPGPRETYAGFRLYARTLEDVPVVVLMLRERGIETASRMQDIAPMIAIDRALGRLLLAVALVAGFGFLLSLTAGLLGNVQRKRRLFASLRLMGFRRGALLLVPMTEAAIVSLLGAALASGLALAAQGAINAGATGIPLDGALSALTPAMLGAAAGITLVAALLASGLAAWQAASVEPHEAVRAP